MNLDNLLSGLLGDWRKPDGANRANQQMDEMDYPQFSSLLKYRMYDRESGLFINDKTVGFVLECSPLVGANENIVEALDYFLRNKLPRKVPLTFTLLGSKCVSHLLDYGLSDSSWTGPMRHKFNHITQAYYESGALNGLPNKKGYPLTLRNYRLFVSYAEEHSHPDDSTLNGIQQTLSSIQQALNAAQLFSRELDAQGLLSVVHEMANFRHDQISPSSVKYNPYEEINTQCVDRSINLKIKADHIVQSLSSSSGRQTTRIKSFMLEKNPDKFFLWQQGDNISRLLDPTSSIPCPFVMTLTVEVEGQKSTQNEANTKFISLDKKANSAFAKWVPGVKDAYKEWGAVRERLNKNQSSLARYFFNITLFNEDDDAIAQKNENAVLNTYRNNGLSLFSPTFMQMRNYLSIFPFLPQEGLWSDLKRTSATLRAEAFHVANMFPIIGDNRGNNKGLPIPSYRNQLAFLNLFDQHSPYGNDNYNLAIAGYSGSGKSFLMQSIIRQILDSGGRCWVFDMGDSYKGLCTNVGGVYLDASELRFNPFANIVDIGESAESIRNLLVVLANPSGDMDDTHQAIMLKAVHEVWKEKQNSALIDDVVDYIKREIKTGDYKDSITVRGRMEEIVISLDKYTTGGIYGDYFNSAKPSLDDEVRFSVLEMGKLQNKPDLLAAIMFSMMIYVEQRMYLAPRNEIKACVIDEAWKLLSNDNKRAESFIEDGYRTARKYLGAYITISQGIQDFDGDKASGAAQAGWSNSSFKIIMRQDIDTFKKYNLKNLGQFNKLEQALVENFPAAKLSGFSAFMLRVGGQSTFHRLMLDPLSRAMCSSNGDDFEFRERCMREGMDIDSTIYQLALKEYPEEMAKLEAWGTAV